MAATIDTDKSSMHQIVKHHKLQPFKIHLEQELNKDDSDPRLQFCETLVHLFAKLYLYWICFSNEASFIINGAVNRQNCHYWSDHNPPWIKKDHKSQRN